MGASIQARWNSVPPCTRENPAQRGRSTRYAESDREYDKHNQCEENANGKQKPLHVYGTLSCIQSPGSYQIRLRTSPLWAHLPTSRARRRLRRLWCQQRTFAIPAKPNSARPRVPPPGRIRSNPHEQMRTRSIVCADDESRHAIPVEHNIRQPTGRRSRAALFVRYIFPVILRSECDATLANKAAARLPLGTHARR